MTFDEAQNFVSCARSHWILGGCKLPDDRFLRWRERLHNGMTMFFAILVLIGFFFLPGIWGLHGVIAMMYWKFGVLSAFVFAARRHSVTANQFRDVRRFMIDFESYSAPKPESKSAEQAVSLNRP